MVAEASTVAYLVIGLFVFYKSLQYFDKRNSDGDPEGLDALVSLGIACLWPVTVPLYGIYRLFRG